MKGAIDIVCNVFTPREVRLRQSPSDDVFRDQVRQPKEIRKGVPIPQYLKKMDRARIERSLLIAVRAGDLRVKGSTEVPYRRVYDICQKHPDRFSGLAGVDPTRGPQGLRDLEMAVQDYGFVGAHLYPHWFEFPPDAPLYYPYYEKCSELGIPIMMQVGHNLIYQRHRRLPSVGQPIFLDRVAIDFPDLRLIGIHIGVPWTDEMISMAWKHENVYIGGDAYAPKHWPESLVHYANTYGQDKFMFGTDWPVIDPERAMREVAEHNFRPGPRRKILRDNAIRVFKLAPSRAKAKRKATASSA